MQSEQQEIIENDETNDEATEKNKSLEGEEQNHTKMEKEVVFERISEDEEILSLNLLDKNTSSFRCLAQITMSSSSIMNQTMRFFPPLQDPGLDAALNYIRKKYKKPRVNFIYTF